MYEENLPEMINVSTSSAQRSIKNIIPPVLHAGEYLLELAVMETGDWEEISQPVFLESIYSWRNL